MSTRDHENEDEFRHGNEYKHEDDDFGLPEVEYDQVRDEEEEVVFSPEPSSSPESSPSSSLSACLKSLAKRL